jgi:hypothetical protein
MQLDEVAHADMDWIYPTRDSVQCCVNNAGCGESSRALVGSYVLQWKTLTVGYTSTTRMPPDVFYVWDFPTSSTVQHTSAQCPGTFLSPRTFGFHKRRGYLT